MEGTAYCLIPLKNNANRIHFVVRPPIFPTTTSPSIVSACIFKLSRQASGNIRIVMYIKYSNVVVYRMILVLQGLSIVIYGYNRV